jgi:hypothetical protein
MVLFRSYLMAIWVVWSVLLAEGFSVQAAPVGPTLHLAYGADGQPDNPLVHFMYFVPLVSPEPVSVFTNAGNTQRARVTSLTCQTNGAIFRAICEFELSGTGLERNVFDHSALLKHRENDLKAGKLLEHQLAAITVTDGGLGSMEITGVLTNGAAVATEVRLKFDGRGRSSPVSIELQDLGPKDGSIQPENEMVARVAELTFHKQADKAQMEVTLVSIKPKGASDGLWQNLLGGIKGMAANLFIPPLKITEEGHQAMMDFGLALAMGRPAYTFPYAERLKADPAPSP